MELLAKALRILTADMICHVNSGHPGLPLGMADVAVLLWKNFLRIDPSSPTYFNRDRFILSNGHGSAMLYSLLHFFGFPINIEDLKNFRQLGSITPGHPEHSPELGIDTTTGPLGQGFANGVGMALVEKWLADEFNRPDFPIIDHYTYVFVGDGCLMEGISHEAAGIAGTHCLNKLIVLWDNNGISIDGEVKNWWNEDTPKRFEAYGWKVLSVDGNGEASKIIEAISQARQSDRPVLIDCRTKIGYGCQLAGCAKVHGSPLEHATITEMRKDLDWHYPPFVIPEEVYEETALIKEKNNQERKQWEDLLIKYTNVYPELANDFKNRIDLNRSVFTEKGKEDFYQFLLELNEVKEQVATRKASHVVLNFLSKQFTFLLGGSADLTPSNLTRPDNAQDLFPNVVKVQDKPGYFHYGVREFGMFAVMNGIALHGGYLPYGGGFLVFSGYGENAIRMSAMMKLKVIYVFTHDSIGVGEDGPTHQPIEHLTMLRAIPGLLVLRPGNMVETVIAWKKGLEYHGPSVLALSRQKVFSYHYSIEQLALIEKGGYVLWENSLEPEWIFMASGSELGIAYETAKLVDKLGFKVRVVSIWSQELFDGAGEEYYQKILPSSAKKVAIEAGNGLSWYKYVDGGRIISMETFGSSAPDEVLFDFYGFTPEKIVEKLLIRSQGDKYDN